MKLYKIATINAVKFILRDYLSKPGRKTTGEALRIVEANTLGVGRSTCRNIITGVFDEITKEGAAKKLYRGTWEVLDENGCVAPASEVIKKVKVDQPVVFDPQLVKFLDPPKCTKHVEVYNELKKLKDKSKFFDMAIVLCDKAGISINRLINYIYEVKQARDIERAGTECVHAG